MLSEQGDAVLEAESVVGLEALNVLAVLDGTREAFAVGPAMPRLDAAEGSVGRRPDAEDRGVENDGEQRLALFVE